MKTCPQCGYERKSNDDHFTSPEECPKCGIIYRRWQAREVPVIEAPAVSVESFNKGREWEWKQYKVLLGAGLILIVVVVLARWLLFSGSQSTQLLPLRIESTLPVTMPLGMESNSCLIRTSDVEKAVVAAGQIFSPPVETPVLFKVGFMFVRSRFVGVESDVKLQIRLSEWLGSHPAATDLWVSDTIVIRRSDKDIHVEWQKCDVPHIPLNPAKQYIAWVTLDGMGNSSDAGIGIPGMGPRYSSPSGHPVTNPYPKGRRVLYRHPLPDEDGTSLDPPGWEIHAAGHNLHFTMSFENRAH